jgi:hypothetical protein
VIQVALREAALACWRHFPPSPFSTSRRMASARAGISGWRRRQSSSLRSHSSDARIWKVRSFRSMSLHGAARTGASRHRPGPDHDRLRRRTWLPISIAHPAARLSRRSAPRLSSSPQALSKLPRWAALSGTGAAACKAYLGHRADRQMGAGARHLGRLFRPPHRRCAAPDLIRRGHRRQGSGLPAEALAKAGEPSRIRTCDLLIKSQLLYQLSYGP